MVTIFQSNLWVACLSSFHLKHNGQHVFVSLNSLCVLVGKSLIHFFLSVIGRSRRSIGSGVSVSTLGLWGVLSLSGVGDLGHEAVVVISGVGGGLDTAVGESDGEGSGNVSFGVLALSLLEVGLGVIVGYSVLVGERLRGEFLWFVSRSRVVGWGRGAVGWGVVPM